MGAIKVPTTFNIELEFEVPEFYRRMLALIIDMVIEFFYIKIAIEILKSVESNSWDSDSYLNNQAIWATLMLPIAFYHVLMEITMNGQSVGKKIMGLRVVDEKGGKASISQFLIRWLLRISDLWMIILWFLLIYISYFGARGNTEMVFFLVLGFAFLITDIVLVVSSRKGQRIGDILAHTIIIRTNPRSDIEQTVFQEVADSYVPSFPEIMKLSDKDINAIKSILETAKKKNDFNMAANASDKIKGHLKISSSMSPFDFLETLLKDYNYLSTK
jgi:uncharacterized RDD family membrane protein YckC